MQLRNANKKSHGRRFTIDDKLMALSLYKHSPSTYRFMHNILILPSISTVKRQLSKIELDTGINSNVAELLTNCVTGMKDERQKVQLLMWDEAFLKAHIWYDSKKDKIIGFEDFGNRRTSNFADHILTFMIRGLLRNTKLPLSYYFCNSQTSYSQLMDCIKENVKLLKDTGLQLVATVCDQGTSNVKAIKELRRQYEKNCFRKGEEPGTLFLLIIELNMLIVNKKWKLLFIIL